MSRSWAFVLLPALLGLAGCAHPQSSGESSTSPPPGLEGAASPLRTLPIEFDIAEVATGMGTLCDFAHPATCGRGHFEGTLDFTGDWQGSGPYVAYIFYNQTANYIDFDYSALQFTGTMAGCGTGTVTMRIQDHVDLTPSTQGVHGVGWVDILPGTASAGLAGVPAQRIPSDIYLGEKGFNFHESASIQCREVPVQQAPSDPTQMQTLPLEFDISQTVAPIGLVCNVADPESCERVHYQGNLIFSGSWQGSAPYVAYELYNTTGGYMEFWYTAMHFTGTMASCGTGTIALTARDHLDGPPGLAGQHGVGWFDILPGSASEGLARVVPQRIPFTYEFNQGGTNFHAKTTMQCLVPAPVAPAAPASNATTLRAVPLDLYLAESSSMDGTMCDFSRPATCDRAHFQGTLDFHDGTWVGSAPYVAYMFYNATGNYLDFLYTSIVFSGTIHGCGVGSIAMTANDHLTGMPDANGQPLVGSIDIVAGSGTGGLAGVPAQKIPVEGYAGPSGMDFHVKATAMKCP